MPSARPISPETSSATSASGPCPRAPKLHHVKTAIIRLNDGRQRAAFAQRSYISGSANGTQLSHRELMIGALHANVLVNSLDQIGSEFRDQRNKGIETFLQVILGEYEPMQGRGIA